MSRGSDDSNTSDERLIQDAATYDEKLNDESSQASLLETEDPKLSAVIRLLHTVFRVADSDAPTESLSDSSRDPSGAEIPDRIDRFTIRGVLGSGGFANVYRAYDEVLHREVAIKALKKNHTSGTPDDIRLHEARAAARLNHSNLVPIYEVLDLEHGLFLVTEFCDGPTLSAWLKEHGDSLSISSAVEITVRLAGAIDHAHSRSLVHRDIKPANVILTKTDNDPRLPFEPRLTDFGLVRDLTQAIDGKSNERLVGTFRYMSPEQFLNRQNQHDEACDQYSLGVLFYRLLTGQLPHADHDGIEMLTAVCTRDPKPLREVKATIPRDLEAICLRCLQLKPSDRYPSVSAMRADLRRFQEGQEVSARTRPVFERTIVAIRRRPVEAGLLVLVMIAIATAAGISMVNNRKLRRQSETLHLAVTRAEDAEFVAETSLHNERTLRQIAEESKNNSTRAAFRSDLRLAFASLARGDNPDAVASIERIEAYADQMIEKDFAFHLLKSLANQGYTRLMRSNLPITEILALPAKKQIVIGGADGIVRIFDDQSGTLVREFNLGEGKSICALSANRAGTQIAIGVCDQPGFAVLFPSNTINMISEGDEVPKRIRTGFPSTIESLAFLPNEDYLAVGCRYEPVHVISLIDDEFLTTLPSSRRNEELLISADDGTITFVDEFEHFVSYDADTFQLTSKISAVGHDANSNQHRYGIHRIVRSHQDRFVAAIIAFENTRRVALIDLDAKPLSRLDPASEDSQSADSFGAKKLRAYCLDEASSNPRFIAFSDDDSELIVATQMGVLVRYRVDDVVESGTTSMGSDAPAIYPAPFDRRVIHRGGINVSAIDSLGRVVCGGEDGDVMVCDRPNDDRSMRSAEPSTAISALDRSTIVTGHADGSVQKINIETGKSVTIHVGKGIGVCELSVGPKREMLAIGYFDGTADLVDLATNQPLIHSIPPREMNPSRDAVESIVFDDNGNHAAICVGGFSLQIVDINRHDSKRKATMQCEHYLGKSTEAIWFSSPSALCLLGDVTRTFECVQHFDHVSAPGMNGANAVVVDHRLNIAYSGSDDGRIRRHDFDGLILDTSDRWGRLDGETGAESTVAGLALDANDQYLIAGDEMGNLSIWDASDLQFIGRFHNGQNKASVKDIFVSPDNRWIAFQETAVEYAYLQENSRTLKLIMIE